MFNAFIVFLSVMILGAIIFVSAYSFTPESSTKFLKWYFGIFFVLGVVGAVLTLVGVIQL